MIGISTSTYYYRPKRPRWGRELEDAEIRDAIGAIQIEHPCAGYRTVQVYLRRKGRWIGERRIRRVMKQFCLQAEIKRAFVRTTDSNHPHRVYANLLEGRTLSGINQAWGADFTYIRITNGFVYLAVILDLFSRRVVGWAISKHIDAELALSDAPQAGPPIGSDSVSPRRLDTKRRTRAQSYIFVRGWPLITAIIREAPGGGRRLASGAPGWHCLSLCDPIALNDELMQGGPQTTSTICLSKKKFPGLRSGDVRRCPRLT